jgi:hypothetical protein
MNKPIEIGDCYLCKDGFNNKAMLLILGYENDINIYFIGIKLHSFHINFCPIHKDVLADSIIELLGNNIEWINTKAYYEDRKIWLDTNNGGRTYFTQPTDYILKTALEMYLFAKNNNQSSGVERDNKIILTAFFPSSLVMLQNMGLQNNENNNC